VADRKDQEPQFGQLDDLGENTASSFGLRSDGPLEPATADDDRPGISSASGLTTRDQPVETHPALPGTPGEALRDARESKGLDIASLAQRTRLSRKTIEDLESNRFGEIPPTYVRGYLRAVARELDADGDAWVRGFEHLGYAEPSIGPVTKGSAAGTAKRPSRGPWYLLAVLVVFVVLALGFYLLQTEQAGDTLDRLSGFSLVDSNPSEGAAADTTGVAVEAPVAGLQSPIDRAFAPVLAEEPDVDPTAGDVRESPVELGFGLADHGAGAAAAASSEPTPRIPGAGRVLLGLSFEETSWAEIRSANDRVELRGVFDRGERRSIEVELPARVVLGNAPGVALDLDGARVDLAPHTQSDRTARFSVGADR